MAFSASPRALGSSKRGDQAVKQRLTSQPAKPVHRSTPHQLASSASRSTRAMSKMINSPDALVQQAIDGVLMSSPDLARLDGYPDIKVVFNKNLDKNKVAIISGGGAGHEPAHAGYVGNGMLTAAVAGEVFASPSAEAVLAAIRQVTGSAGCLLIIKNYTGDRLHFGLAAEQAKAEGIKVEMIVVGEDVAIDNPGIAGRRGLAGTALVHKIAGAAAASGASLEEVHKAAQAAADNMGTLGVAVRMCAMPGKAPSDRIKEGEVEIGLGIHGEPGFETTKAMSAEAQTQRMMKQLTASPFFKLESGERVVLMVNNLGGSTALEMACLAREAITYLQQTAKVTVERCYAGLFMTSLDAAGCSLTLMKIEAGKAGDAQLAALDSPVTAAGWPHTPAKVVKPNVVPVPKGPDGSLDKEPERPSKLSPAGAALEKVLKAMTDKLISEADNLNKADAKVGDGDCGDTLLHGSEAIQKDLKACYPLNDTAATMSAVARSVRKAVGGTSGALYEVALTSAAASLRESGTKDVGPAQWAAALKAGAQAVQKYGGAKPGSRTMLDALLPAAEALQAAADKGSSGPDAAGATAAAAQEGAKATANMAASAGRASYVPEEVLKSNPDPGAVAVGIWLAAAAEQIKENSLVKA